MLLFAIAWCALLAGAGLRVKRHQRSRGETLSNTDSFIEEVSEEVRRDQLFKLFKRYGWIAVVLIGLLVGGTAWNEWRKAQETNAAEALGDQILAALEGEDSTARADALGAIDTPEGGARGIIGLLAAAEAGDETPQVAAANMLALADDPAVPQVYRQIAVIKAISLPGNELSETDRRTRLDGLLVGGGLVRLLAEEQLAFIDIETGNVEAGLDRLRQISESAETSIGMRQRAAQMILALGGELEPAQDAASQDATTDE